MKLMYFLFHTREFFFFKSNLSNNSFEFGSLLGLLLNRKKKRKKWKVLTEECSLCWYVHSCMLIDKMIDFLWMKQIIFLFIFFTRKRYHAKACTIHLLLHIKHTFIAAVFHLRISKPYENRKNYIINEWEVF